MAEYIEREKAIEEIDSWLDSVGSIIVGKGLSSYGELIGCMQDVPAADVVEVKHAHWVLSSAFEVFGGEEQAWGRNPIADCSCSNCHKSPYCEENFLDNDTLEQIMTDFCPNCGARMDGEK